MNISKVLPDTIVVETLSRTWNQSIEYEWIPKFHNNCIILEHTKEECWFEHAQIGKQIRLNQKDRHEPWEG